jgi:hypothetical protein
LFTSSIATGYSSLSVWPFLEEEYRRRRLQATGLRLQVFLLKPVA